MSRQSIMPPRALTLTEELERLEQSITLVLQEIDHNFSRAHRIVSGSIIPIVEQYAKHSDAVWEGSKFWKQFFEASANVSLSSYEEMPEEDYTVTEQSNVSEHVPADALDEDDTVTATHQQKSASDSPATADATQGTPAQFRAQESIEQYSSPYEALRGEMGDASRPSSSRPRNVQPSTPGDTSTARPKTPPNQSSPVLPPSTQTDRFHRQHNDPLLHRVLDKTFRVAATPHTARKKPAPPSAKATAPATKTQASSRANPALDSSPFSPAMAAPELRSEIFGSPSARPLRSGAASGGPRTPGISVLKGKAKTPLSHRRDNSNAQNPLSTEQHQRTPAGPSTWDDRLWDSDSDTNDAAGLGGMSPPKTMQFHVPQSRLMQTPAKEASRRIVEDLLSTAGAASVTSTLEEFDIDLDVGGDGEGGGGIGEDDSPSIVRMVRHDEDDDDF